MNIFDGINAGVIYTFRMPSRNLMQHHIIDFYKNQKNEKIY